MTAAHTINDGSPELGRGPPDSSPLSGRRRLFCKARRAGQAHLHRPNCELGSPCSADGGAHHGARSRLPCVVGRVLRAEGAASTLDVRQMPMHRCLR